MKQIILFLMALCLNVLAMQAQDCLEPISKTRSKTLDLSFYDQELQRLLNPNNADWGVLRLPSLMTESSLTYDEKAHALIYTKIDGILWGAVRDATTEEVDTIINVEGFGPTHYSRYIDLTEVRDYHAPGTQTWSLPISKKMIKTLRQLWSIAIDGAQKNNMMVLDGCPRIFFVGEKRAKSHYFTKEWPKISRLVQLVDDMMKAVQEGDAAQLAPLETEAAELYQLFVKGTMVNK